MICKNCNTFNPEGQKYCTKCGMPLIIPQDIPNIPQTVENKNLPNILCLLSLFAGFVSSVINSICLRLDYMLFGEASLFTGVGSLISRVAPLAALGLMIYVRVKYPDNVFGKVLMWIYIVVCIFGVIFIVVSLVSCAIAINECSGY